VLEHPEEVAKAKAAREADAPKEAEIQAEQSAIYKAKWKAAADTAAHEAESAAIADSTHIDPDEVQHNSPAGTPGQA